MISVLIPTYNYNIIPLVKELYKQLSSLKIPFEILAYDDASKLKFITENEKINLIDNCVYKVLPKNIGRSAIRNLLGANAKYDMLLFLDADTFPKKKDFVKNYFSENIKTLVNGGVVNMKPKAKRPYLLRWLYTKKRESKSLSSANFYIKKSIFLENPFDESIKKYGCEDVVFFNSLLNKKVEIVHIKNPVIHNSSDDANTFIDKTELAVQNLIELIDKGKLKKESYKVSMVYEELKKIGLVNFTGTLFEKTKPFLMKNFNSSFPSLILYDFYRLGYYCLLKNKK